MAREMPPTRRGYKPFHVVSAIQKAVRRSDPEAVVYWGAEMFKSGYGAWAWKRLRIIMTEDVGLGAAPGTIADIEALHAAALDFKAKAGRQATPEEGFFFWIHAAMLLVLSPKSRTIDWMYMVALTDHAERREIPDEAMDVHTQEGRKLGRRWEHFVEESGRLIAPDEAAKSRGFKNMAEELASIDYRYVEQFMQMQPGAKAQHDLPVNPWAKRTQAHAKGSEVKTHHVSRPLGIPLPGAPSDDDDNGEENGDD